MAPIGGRSTKPRYCQVASNLDSNPKIRKAKNLGRQVFEFALRRNAEPDNPELGKLPARVLESWFIADQLMMEVTEGDEGLSLAVTAGLLHRDGDFWVITGWEDHWGERPKDGAERQKKYKENQKKRDSDGRVTEPSSPNVTGDSGDALDKRRVDKKRVEREADGDPPPPEPLDLRNRQALRVQVWDRLNVLRRDIAAELGAAYRLLHPQDPGEAELAARIMESGADAAANCDHVLAVFAAEARAKRTLQFMGGAMFRLPSWSRAMAMTVVDAEQGDRRPALANGADEQPRRIKTL